MIAPVQNQLSKSMLMHIGIGMTLGTYVSLPLPLSSFSSALLFLSSSDFHHFCRTGIFSYTDAARWNTTRDNMRDILWIRLFRLREILPYGNIRHQKQHHSHYRQHFT